MTRVIKSCQVMSGTFPEYELDPLVPNTVEESGPDPAEILARARAKAERIAQEAYSEGFKRGLEVGAASFQEQMAESGEALRAVAESIKEANEAFLESLVPQVAELAVAIAAPVLRREAETDKEPVPPSV